jgi:16S rRNA (guanine527-N7)-methyltransferase
LSDSTPLSDKNVEMAASVTSSDAQSHPPVQIPSLDAWRSLPLDELLGTGAKQLGIALSDEQIGHCLRYLELLMEWNGRMNLTAIRDPHEALVKHFLDSMAVLPLLPEQRGLRLVDVGTGAGFPGLTLKILRPDLDLLLLDSLRKRLTFLDAVVSELGLKGVQTLHSRAEDAGRNPAYREKFDIVTARAVAELGKLAGYCLPLCRVNGRFIAMKGPRAEDEQAEAQALIRQLSGEFLSVQSVALPYLGEPRLNLVYRKIRSLPH